MMQVLLDTNIVLDILLEREEWWDAAEQIWQAHERKQITAFVTATTLTDVFYVGRANKGQVKAMEAVRHCVKMFPIIDVTAEIVSHALNLPGTDFEDNVQIACTASSGLDAIVTRDKTGFAQSTVPVFTPTDFLVQMNLNGEL
jgi:predicted nucleic acid-binding protein